MLRTDTASRVFEPAVRELHEGVVDADRDSAVVRLTDLFLIVKTNLAALSSETAARIPDDLTDAVVSVHDSERSVAFVDLVGALRLLALVLPLIAAACFAGVLALAEDARVGLLKLGGTTIALAVLGTIVTLTARRLLVDGAVGRSIWGAFVLPLERWILILAAIGAGVSALASLGVGETPVADRAKRLAHLARRRTVPTHRLRWSLAVGAVGVVQVAEPTTVLTMVVVVVGVALVAAAARESVAVVAPSLLEGARRRRGTDGSTPTTAASTAEPCSSVLARWAAALGVIVLAEGSSWVSSLAATPRTTRQSPAPSTLRATAAFCSATAGSTRSRSPQATTHTPPPYTIT